MWVCAVHITLNSTPTPTTLSGVGVCIIVISPICNPTHPPTPEISRYYFISQRVIVESMVSVKQTMLRVCMCGRWEIIIRFTSTPRGDATWKEWGCRWCDTHPLPPMWATSHHLCLHSLFTPLLLATYHITPFTIWISNCDNDCHVNELIRNMSQTGMNYFISMISIIITSKTDFFKEYRWHENTYEMNNVFIIYLVFFIRRNWM